VDLTAVFSLQPLCYEAVLLDAQTLVVDCRLGDVTTRLDAFEPASCAGADDAGVCVVRWAPAEDAVALRSHPCLCMLAIMGCAGKNLGITHLG